MPDVFLRSGQPDDSAEKPTGERIEPVFLGEPGAPALAGAAASAAAPDDTSVVFSADLPGGADTLGRGAVLAPVAELLAHQHTAPPLTVGLFGGPGTGKSFTLGQLLDRVSRLAAAATGLGAKTPFLSRIATIRIEAARCTGDPATAIAAEIFRSLTSGTAGGDSYAALAQEAAHAARDPHVVAREAGERLTEARQRLHAERQALHDLDGRRAKLVETVLYETAGSHVDTYARANRSRIEARLRTFGFTQGDPLATYRDLVRDVAEAGGTTSRISMFSRALWTYRGQTRLLVTAVILLALAWGSAHAAATQDAWLPWLRGTGDFGASMATWITAHTGWIATLDRTAIAAACLAVATCIWRAVRFIQPISRGAALLGRDLESRRRDLDGMIAHQTRRVDALGTEVDALAHRAEEAGRRASAANQATARRPAPLVDSPFEPAQEDDAHRARLADAFTASLDGAILRSAESPFLVPQRILIAIDDLDSLPPARAASFIEAAHRLLSAKSFVVLFAADPRRLAAAWGEADYPAYLHRNVQVLLHLAAVEPDRYGNLVRSLVGSATAQSSPPPALDGGRSVLDLPWRSGEADLIAALGPLAGHSPRSVKRFINVYRLTHTLSENYPALALLLALDAGGSDAERRAMAAALADAEPSARLHFAGEPRLAQALEACRAARGGDLTVADVRAVRAIAAAYSV